MISRPYEYDTKSSQPISDLIRTKAKPIEENKDGLCSHNLLFDREEFATYFYQIDQYKANFKINNDFAAAQTGLLQLIIDFPDYPDAYIALGEISAKIKDHANAVVYYQRAHLLCPFNDNLSYLIALQCERVNKFSAAQPTYQDLNIEKFFAAAKAERNDERSFRHWYHVKLRQILIPLHLVNTAKLLRDDLDEDSDYSDISLTNGAVVDAYYGNKAFEKKLFAIAKYYYQKAIFKYEHDFISASKCAEIYYHAGETHKSLEEITRLINKYNYSISYSIRSSFYTAGNENGLAVADIIKCLTIADKSDMDLIKAQRENVLTLLNIEEENNSIGPSSNDNSTIEIMKLHQKISNSAATYNCADEIQSLSQILKNHPAKVLAYTVRGDAFHKKGDIKSALLDYSLALWFSFGSQMPEIYYSRSCLNLALGEFNAAHYDLNNAIYCLQHENKNDEIDSLLQRFSAQCLTAGNLHLQNGNFYSAEKIFASGIIRKPSLKLYLQFAIALGIQEHYDAALSALTTANKMQNISLTMQAEIQKQIKLFTAKKRRLQQQNLYNLKGRQIKRARININFVEPEELYDAPENLIEAMIQSKTKKNPARIKAKKINTPQKKKRACSTHYIHSLLTDETQISPDVQIIPDNVETVSKQDNIEKNRNLIRNNKIKIRKAKLKNLRAKAKERINPADEKLEDSDSDSLPVPSLDNLIVNDSCDSANALPRIENKIDLLDSEKEIFALFNTCKAEQPEANCKILITGGWALDRARQHYFDIPLPTQMCDIDIVTDIPYATIEKLCPTLVRIPQVDGLFTGKLGDIHVDVVQRASLKNLALDALSRDFLPIYIDENGTIHDPIRSVITQMRDGILKSACPISEVFKRDPLTILRAIYISSKRNLKMTDLKNQICIDKKLLIPDLENDLFHPYRFNNLIKKVFSQKFAQKNYDLMRELGLLTILFPEISYDLEMENDWMREQMKNTDKYTWPKLEIIYANMIACAVMNEIREILPAQLKERQAEIALIMGSEISLTADGHATIKLDIEEKLIKSVSARIMQNSLLFQNRFTSVENLHKTLVKSINEWKYFQNTKLFNSISPPVITSVAANTPSRPLGSR